MDLSKMLILNSYSFPYNQVKRCISATEMEREGHTLTYLHTFTYTAFPPDSGFHIPRLTGPFQVLITNFTNVINLHHN